MDDKLKQAIDRRMAGAALPEASKARILQAVTGGKERRRMKTKRRMILVAAAVLLLITGCVAAAVYLDWARQTMDDWEQDHGGTPGRSRQLVTQIAGFARCPGGARYEKHA